MNTTIAQLDPIVHTLVETLHTHPFGQRMYAGAVTRDEYAAFLVQTYHYVVHTRPVLRRAGERLQQMGKLPLAQLFLHKADEENGHDLWLLDDLQAIGERPDRVHQEKPVPAVLAFITWNAFVVEHGLPIGILGAAYVLEAISARYAHAMAQNLVQKSGIRAIQDGVRFLNGHGDADIDHIAELAQVIESVASSPSYRDEIVITARMTKSTYIGLYTALAERHADRRPAFEVNAVAS